MCFFAPGASCYAGVASRHAARALAALRYEAARSDPGNPQSMVVIDLKYGPLSWSLKRVYGSYTLLGSEHDMVCGLEVWASNLGPFLFLHYLGGVESIWALVLRWYVVRSGFRLGAHTKGPWLLS